MAFLLEYAFDTFINFLHERAYFLFGISYLFFGLECIHE